MIMTDHSHIVKKPLTYKNGVISTTGATKAPIVNNGNYGAYACVADLAASASLPQHRQWRITHSRNGAVTTYTMFE